MTDYTSEQRDAWLRVSQHPAAPAPPDGVTLKDDIALLAPLLPSGMVVTLPESEGWYVSRHNEAWWHSEGAWWKHGHELTKLVDVEEHMPLDPLVRSLHRDQVTRALDAANQSGYTTDSVYWKDELHMALVEEQTS